MSWKQNINGLILASKSPRRKEILLGTGIDFIVETVDIGDEYRFFENKEIKNAIILLAKEKGKFVCEKYPDVPVLSADTVVVLNKNVLGKPKNAADANMMLKMLSGRKHSVYTAVNLACKKINFNENFLQKTDVWFRRIDDNEIEEYLKKANFSDKAGGYGIQEDGKYFIEKINGDYSNVMGLPICTTINLLKKYTARIK
ncbi:MAG: Maf family protein [Chitinispirillales bacterium]|jgi:septum formation protein|nr:Maf family protein [Chitinispirillales bacterium]